MALYKELSDPARRAFDLKWGCLHSHQQARHRMGGTCLIYMTLECSRRTKSNL